MPPTPPPSEGNVPSVSHVSEEANVSEDASGDEPSTGLLDDGPSTYVYDNPSPLASLDAREITAWFGDHMVLEQVSLTMYAGRVTALIGPSGCGKSTFLRILNRMHQLIPGAALAGEVLLDGIDIYDPSQ